MVCELWFDCTDNMVKYINNTDINTENQYRKRKPPCDSVTEFPAGRNAQSEVKVSRNEWYEMIVFRNNVFAERSRSLPNSFTHTGIILQKMAGMTALSSGEGQNSTAPQPLERLRQLYPAVNTDETPLPKSWSPKDKYTFIGLSQNNLRVHYKGTADILQYFDNDTMPGFRFSKIKIDAA